MLLANTVSATKVHGDIVVVEELSVCDYFLYIVNIQIITVSE